LSERRSWARGGGGGGFPVIRAGAPGSARCAPPRQPDRSRPRARDAAACANRPAPRRSLPLFYCWWASTWRDTFATWIRTTVSRTVLTATAATMPCDMPTSMFARTPRAVRGLLGFFDFGDFRDDGRWEAGFQARRRERRLLLSWAKAGNDSKGRSNATRSEGDDLGDSPAGRALMRHGGRGRGGRGKNTDRKPNFFDCWWALFGNRAAGKNDNGGHSVYTTKHRLTNTTRALVTEAWGS